MEETEARKLPDWIDAYLQYTKETEPPELYKLWVAIFIISSTLERRSWQYIWNQRLFPNMYIVLVGPPAARKGTAMSTARFFLEGVGCHIAAENTTREALIKRMEENGLSFLNPETNEQELFCAVSILSSELVVFFRKEDEHLMRSMCQWFDCENKFTYDTKGSGTNYLHNVWVNLLGAITPDLLQQAMPPEAIGGGFASRTIFVHGLEKSKSIAFPEMSDEEMKLGFTLLEDLQHMKNWVEGPFTMSETYKEFYTEWYKKNEEKPVFIDHLFQGYLGRRPVHIRKLSMICCASRGGGMTLEVEDIIRAETILVETEKEMTKVFSGYGKNDLADILPRLMQHIQRYRELSKDALYRFFYRDVSPPEFDQLLRTLAEIKYCKIISKKKGLFIIYDEEGAKENEKNMPMRTLPEDMNIFGKEE